jgi:hypothetical protein
VAVVRTCNLYIATYESQQAARWIRAWSWIVGIDFFLLFLQLNQDSSVSGFLTMTPGPRVWETKIKLITVLFRSIRVQFRIFDTIKIQKKSDKLRKDYCCNKKKVAVTSDNELNEIVQQFKHCPSEVSTKSFVVELEL